MRSSFSHPKLELCEEINVIFPKLETNQRDPDHHESFLKKLQSISMHLQLSWDYVSFVKEVCAIKTLMFIICSAETLSLDRKSCQLAQS